MIDNTNLYMSINRKRILVVLYSIIAFVVILGIDLSIGSSRMSLTNMIQALFAGPGGTHVNTIVVWVIRLPMTLTCVFVGASLGIAGLQLQTITHNPLASP